MTAVFEIIGRFIGVIPPMISKADCRIFSVVFEIVFLSRWLFYRCRLMAKVLGKPTGKLLEIFSGKFENPVPGAVMVFGTGKNGLKEVVDGL